MGLFAKSKRPFSNFEFRCIDLNQKVSQKAYAEGMAKHIHRLAMYKCRIKLPILDAMLQISPNLRSLEFDNLDRSFTMSWEWPMQMSDYVPPITEVTHLKWHDSEAFISTPIFQYLLAVCPKLQSIDLAAGLQHFCSPVCLVMHMNSEASRAAVTEDEFVQFLDRFGPQLKAIAIDELNKPYPYITSIVQYGALLQLEELRLENSQVAVEDINEILESQKTLKILHLRNVMINGETLQIIAKMTELQELKLQQKCWVVDDAGIKQIKSLSKLKVSLLVVFVKFRNKMERSWDFTANFQSLNLEILIIPFLVPVSGAAQLLGDHQRRLQRRTGGIRIRKYRGAYLLRPGQHHIRRFSPMHCQIPSPQGAQIDGMLTFCHQRCYANDFRTSCAAGGARVRGRHQG
jgi:hypothetical protein